MGVVDYIAIGVIVLVLGAAVAYLVRSKKRGDKCVGCPYCKSCSGKCASDKKK